MARDFVRLKLSLIAGGLRGDITRTLAFVVGVAAGVAAAGAGFTGFALLRGAGEAAGDVGVLVFTAFALGWAVAPIFMFRSDETLDPARFALLPLRPRTAAAGLLAAAAVGVAPIAGFIALSGSVVGLTRGAPSVPVAVVAVALTILLCLLLGRTLPLLLLPVLRGRRGSDVMIAGMVLVVGAVVLGQWSISLFGPEDIGVAVVALAGWLRWAPPGMAAQAIADVGAGAHGAAALRLAAVAAVVALLAWCWTRLLGRALTGHGATAGGTTVRASHTGGFGPGWLPPRTAAVLARELRYAWREPRRKANVVTLVLMLGFLLMLTLVVRVEIEGPVPDPSVPLMLMVGSISALTLTSNYFGLQGAALWTTAITTASARDLRAEFSGALLALSVLCSPLLMAFTVLRSLSAAPEAQAGSGWMLYAGVALGGFGLSLGVGVLMSVLLPYALPERSHNPFAGPGAGQGLVVSLALCAAFIVVNILAVPIYLAAYGLGPDRGLHVLIGGALYGAAAAGAGVAIAAGTGARRLPEIMAKVGRPAD
ncbi:ABC-2 type transport system permease protein [Spinactinospora alkalitolerans]|uniref:ABC-2 type transport system permease protein n=1 Tax=Spinactinospora alkalitolerans TaxID=687207 RepID=A0A852U2A2_9ACTN|nr:hypothetical protein [Spinactinospora alkalitolerans]NYE49727.1 ABC-2 type transport system permease protein [Spinactinospora alkalitolerans]